MGEKNDKKKESIDEILSDLNGLLNKMPAILDGIKMPEMQTLDRSKPAQAPVPLQPAPGDKAPAQPFDADKTVVLESFAGLPEGSQAPAEIPAEPASLEPFPAEPSPIPAGPDDVDKTAVLEPFPDLQSDGGVERSGEQAAADKGAAAPEQASLAPQDAGDFIFGQETNPQQEKTGADAPVKLSGSPLEPPSEKPAREAVRGPSLLVSEFTPPAQKEKAPVPEPESAAEILPDAAPEAALPGIPEAAPDQMVFSQGENDAVRTDEQAPAASYSDEAEPEKQAEAPAYDSTRDFGVPDIDALMQMSEGGKPAEAQPSPSLPEAGMIPESVQEIEEQKDGPSFPDLADNLPAAGEAAQADGSAVPEASGPQNGQLIEPPASAAHAQQPEEFEPQFLAAAPQGDIVEGNKPKEEGNELPQPEAASPATEPGMGIVTPEVKPELKPEVKPDDSFDAFTIEPSSSEPQPAQDGSETLRLEPSAEPQPAQDGGETLRLEPSPSQDDPAASGSEPSFGVIGGEAQELRPAEPQGIEFGSFAEPVAEPKLEPGQGIQAGSGAEPAASGIELSPGIDLGGGSPAQSADPGGSGAAGQSSSLSVSLSGDETIPGGPGLELGGPASETPSGDATMVAAPPAGASGDEDKTVIFQASPSTTSRAQAGDLATLSAREVPEGIPADRVRSLVFIYSPGDEALCATVLSELDAICLKSATKPMFIKRAYVKECDIDSNANFIHQSVADSGAAGLICIGAVPQEKIYEIENAFASSGGFFRYYDSSAFTHSSALDLVADLIVR